METRATKARLVRLGCFLPPLSGGSTDLDVTEQRDGEGELQLRPRSGRGGERSMPCSLPGKVLLRGPTRPPTLKFGFKVLSATSLTSYTLFPSAVVDEIYIGLASPLLASYMKRLSEGYECHCAANVIRRRLTSTTPLRKMRMTCRRWMGRREGIPNRYPRVRTLPGQQLLRQTIFFDDETGRCTYVDTETHSYLHPPFPPSQKMEFDKRGTSCGFATSARDQVWRLLLGGPRELALHELRRNCQGGESGPCCSSRLMYERLEMVRNLSPVLTVSAANSVVFDGSPFTVSVPSNGDSLACAMWTLEVTHGN